MQVNRMHLSLFAGAKYCISFYTSVYICCNNVLPDNKTRVWNLDINSSSNINVNC